MIEIVSATRLSEDEFWDKSALGQSLQRLAFDDRILTRLRYSNRLGLPEIYNAAIDKRSDNDILVFVHDDIWIEDFFFADRLIAGLERYDVIGIAGNRRRLPGQPAWPFVDRQFTWDDKANLSGAVAHGREPFGSVTHYGPAPADCELLDGVLLAAKKSVLLSSQTRFDTRFDFHFYDLDFCRTARQNGLRLGTWPISIGHQSGGSFGSPPWADKHRVYFEKWQD
jgi:GT2 family glycosyltransferase